MAAKVAFAVLAIGLAPVIGVRQPTLAGSWQRLPAAPAAASIPYARVGVWTGKQLIVFGRAATPGGMRNVAFSYEPTAGRWRTLTPPAGTTGSFEGATAAVWTGKQMLVWGPAVTLSYDPATNRWQQLPPSPVSGAPSGLLVWTGQEMITWGGGCCGDVTDEGAAYDPATGKCGNLRRRRSRASRGPWAPGQAAS